MLYNASDYKFVDAAPVSDRINGNILPIVNPTSQTAQIYFEDYLFLLEAYYERMNPESEGLNNITVPVRTLNGGNLYALNLNSRSLSGSNTTIAGPQLGYRNDGTYYVSPNTTYPSNHVNTGYEEDSTYYIYSFLQNWMNPCPELKAPYYTMRPYNNPSRLLSDFIRVKFWSFNNMTKMLIGLRPGDWATKMVHQTLKPDGSVNYEYDEGLTNTTISYVRGYSKGRDSQGQTVEYQLFKTIVTYKQSFFTFPYATNATLIWKCSIEQMGGESSSTKKFVWGTKSLSISNGAIQVPTNMLETICDDACTISGRQMNSTIDIYQFYLIVDFAFPARLNGVSWSWQPSYT